MVGGGKDREEMRLIDAEKCPCILCEDTRNAHCTYEHRSCEKFCNWLNNAAFDTEKVVEQLDEMKSLSEDAVAYEKRHGSIEDRLRAESSLKELNRVIYIVKKGNYKKLFEE